MPTFKRTKGCESAKCICFPKWSEVLWLSHTKPDVYSSSYAVLFTDLLLRPNKAEVFQLDGGGALLVWKPVQSSDPVTYCVEYCTDGGFMLWSVLYTISLISLWLESAVRALKKCWFHSKTCVACLLRWGMDAPVRGGDRQLLRGEGSTQRSFLCVQGGLHHQGRSRTLQWCLSTCCHGYPSWRQEQHCRTSCCNVCGISVMS